MAAKLLQTIPSFHAPFWENTLFFSKSTHEIYFVKHKYSFQDDMMCPVPSRRYHISVTRDSADLLQKLGATFFFYQHFHYLDTPSKDRFSKDVVAESGRAFGNVQTAV